MQYVWLLNENTSLLYLIKKKNAKGIKLSQVQFRAGVNGLAYASFILSFGLPILRTVWFVCVLLW